MNVIGGTAFPYRYRTTGMPLNACIDLHEACMILDVKC